MFDLEGNKRIIPKLLIDRPEPSLKGLESEEANSLKEFFQVVEEIPAEAVMLGRSSILERLMAEENISAMRYFKMEALKETVQLKESIDKKGLLFLCMDKLDEDIRKVSAIAQELGTWTVGIAPPSSLLPEDIQSAEGIDNFISFKPDEGDELGDWKICKITKMLWHACQHIGLICIYATDIERLLHLGGVVHAGVGRGEGGNAHLKMALEMALFDFRRSGGIDFSGIKGVLLGVEMSPQDTDYDLREVIDTGISAFGEDPLILVHAEINDKFKDSANVTIVGVD